MFLASVLHGQVISIKGMRLRSSHFGFYVVVKQKKHLGSTFFKRILMVNCQPIHQDIILVSANHKYVQGRHGMWTSTLYAFWPPFTEGGGGDSDAAVTVHKAAEGLTAV